MPTVHSLLSCKQLTELEATAKGLIDELVASGAQATPRLRELLASGERLVAAVQLATGKLGGVLPMAGGVLPTGPDRATVGESGWSTESGMVGLAGCWCRVW